jgi:Caspase domain
MATRACTQIPTLFRRTATLALLVSALTAAAHAQRGVEAIPPTPSAGSGRYYALIIGIDAYRPPIDPLKTAAGDAQALGELLAKNFGFQVQYLLDGQATRSGILEAIGSYANLGESDNLLIYYAGHGYSDPKAKKLFWIPVDVTSVTSPNRIIVDEITTAIHDLPPRHILIISDSCYAADLVRSLKVKDTSISDDFLRKMMSIKSRTLMASGGDEPVSDGGADGHSIFSGWLLRALASETDSAFTASNLFYDSIQRPVAGGSGQTPQYLPILSSDDQGGDFVFERSGKAPIVVAAAPSPAHAPAQESRSLPAPTAQTAPTPPPPISNAGASFDPLLGQFDFGNAVITMASLTPGNLSMLAPGQPPLALVPAGDLRFNDRDVANCSWLFRRDATGGINELIAYFPGGFTIGVRVSGEKLGLNELRSFVGQYRVGAVTITIDLLSSGVLTYSIPNQPPINLRLARGTRFILDGILSTSVEFIRSGNGQIAGLTLHLATGDAFVPRIN